MAPCCFRRSNPTATSPSVGASGRSRFALWCRTSSRFWRCAPAWPSNFFVGVPAPAGAITVLLPIYLYFLGAPAWAPITFVYTLMIALLTVSRLPVFSGKRLGTRVPREMVLPVFVVAVLFVALLLSYPWIVLTLGTLVYLACLPVGFLSYRRFERSAAQAANATPGAEGDAASARST